MSKQAAYQQKKKSLLYSAYDGVSRRAPSVTSGLRMSVQSASPIRLLYEELPKLYAFSARRIFTTFCASFPN